MIWLSGCLAGVGTMGLLLEGAPIAWVSIALAFLALVVAVRGLA